MMRSFYLILFWYLSTRLTLTAQEAAPPTLEYSWPTNASHYLTSAFCEYRARRFHTGIDIKTWGKVGYPVYAIRAGTIWRISVSPYGYGKALYVKLDTGETAVYAHLQKFADEIQEYVEKEQQRRQRYRVNLFLKPDQFLVARDDVIAYTGQTGIGAPHLHFEIRDSHNRPTNPLMKGYQLGDKTHPVIRRVSFTPLEANSEVNGDYMPLIVTPVAEGDGVYRVKDKVQISGYVGLAVSAFDRSPAASSRYGIYSLKLYMDDVLEFQYQYDRTSFANNPMVELERDYRLSRRDMGRFQKLYKDRFNRRAIYSPNKTWAGVLESATLEVATDVIRGGKPEKPGAPSSGLFPGAHNFKIEVADFFDNVSTITGQVVVGDSYDIHAVLEPDGEGKLLVRDIVTYDLKQIEKIHAFQWMQNKWQYLPLGEHFVTPPDKGGQSTFGELFAPTPSPSIQPLDNRPLVLKFVAENQFAAVSYPFFYVNGDSSLVSTEPELSVDYDFYDDYVRLTLRVSSTLRERPTGILYPGQASAIPIEIHQVDLNQYVGRIPFDHLKGEIHRLEFVCENLTGGAFSYSEEIELRKIAAGASARVHSDDNQLRVIFNANSLFRPIYLRTSSGDANTIKTPQPIGDIYTVEPKDGLLRQGAVIELRYPDGTDRPEQLAVYYQTSRGNWIFIDNILDTTAHSVSARVLSFEDFVLGRDDVAPEIRRIRPVNNKRIKDTKPLISANIHDKLSGIQSEREIDLVVDGERRIAEYDPERRQISYQFKKPLAAGRHELVVRARDKSGNQAQKKSFFWVEASNR